MSDNDNFFGSVFEDPDDDPLLGGEGPDSKGSSDENNDIEGQPSWATEEVPANGKADSSTEASENKDATQKQIVVDQHQEAGAGTDEINRAVEQGWRLVRISLPSTGREQAATTRKAHRFVAILEKEEPQSLFDFG